MPIPRDPDPTFYFDGSGPESYEKYPLSKHTFHASAGTMVEWGNYWAKAIRLRDYKHTEAYAGMFSQIGELYNVKVYSTAQLSTNYDGKIYIVLLY